MKKYTTLIPLPYKEWINTGLSPANPNTLKRLLGNPRTSYDQECRDPTNKKFLARIVTQDVGPFKVKGEKLAVASLKRVFDAVRVKNPILYTNIKDHAGMLCCRHVRGSTKQISNHSWGTAIDLRVGGVLDVRGDNRVQLGLFEIYPYFHQEGWWWGAEFNTEDAMHFELAEETILKLYGGG